MIVKVQVTIHLLVRGAKTEACKSEPSNGSQTVLYGICTVDSKVDSGVPLGPQKVRIISDFITALHRLGVTYHRSLLHRIRGSLRRFSRSATVTSTGSLPSNVARDNGVFPRLSWIWTSVCGQLDNIKISLS